MNTITKNREARYIPEGAREAMTEYFNNKEVGSVFYYERGDKLFAIAYKAGAKNPSWHNRFLSSQDRDKKAEDFCNSLTAHKKSVAERRKARSAPHTLKVGDILYASWGYDQTNINFYQVTKLVGQMMVEIREIASKSVSQETTYDNVVAVKDAFIETSHLNNYKHNDPVRKRVSGNHVKVFSYASAGLWDGRPLHETNPMSGH